MDIFIFWDKGYQGAPPLVQKIIDRWEELNPRHKLILLEQKDLDRELSAFDGVRESYGIQAQTDILRVKLLRDYGGVWADATVLPILPLDNWLPNLTTESDFFAFRQCGWDRVIASWFLVSEKRGLLVSRWYEEITRFIDRPRKLVKDTNLFYRLRKRGDYLKSVTPEFSNKFNTYPYYWVHYLFEKCIKEDTKFRDHWGNVAIFPNLPTHSLQHARFGSRMTNEDFLKSLKYLIRCAPVQKLDWRESWPEEVFDAVDPNSVIGGTAINDVDA